jgi:hypothetical protein
MRNRTPRINHSDRENAAAFAQLFLPMPDSQNMLLTISFGTEQIATGVETNSAGGVAVEVPEAIFIGIGAWLSGLDMVIISRSFDLGTVARHAENGYPIPYKTVRAWKFNADGTIHPLTTAEIRDAYSYDSVTGEPLVLDSSEIFADAWTLDI